MNTATVVITGASGFLGRRLTVDAMNRGATVRALSRRGWTPDARVMGVACDVMDVAGLHSAMKGATHVVHAAGLAHVFGNASISTDRFAAVNVIGTANVISAAVGAGVQHVVHVSSVSIYGPHGYAVCTEESPCHPTGPYAISKLHAEQRARAIVQGSKSALTILRLATLYGEEDPGNIARLIRAIDSGRFVWIGDGSTRKSLMHRDDAARACLNALFEVPPSTVSLYNLSSPPVTMQEVVSGLANGLERRIPSWRLSGSLVSGVTRFIGDTLNVARVAAWDETIRKWLSDDVYDGSRFDDAYSFRASVALADGLSREVKWYRTQVPPVIP